MGAHQGGRAAQPAQFTNHQFSFHFQADHEKKDHHQAIINQVVN